MAGLDNVMAHTFGIPLMTHGSSRANSRGGDKAVMRYRELGRTGLKVSEIGFGAEWMPGDDAQKVARVVAYAAERGVNIVDCWMADPAVRKTLGAAVCAQRDKWIVQGHLGSTWQNEQYTRTREMDQVIPAWEQLLDCFGGHIELGLIHYVDMLDEFDQIMAGPFIEYVRAEKAAGHIDHIGLSTHNPDVALHAAQVDDIEMIMFSINPAFDLLPASEDINDLFAEEYEEGLRNIDPVREQLYALCEKRGVGITVMKGFAGGRLFDAEKSPFGVAMTPVQCAHYCLTRPGIASVMAGFRDEGECDGCLAYETATDQEKDYASILANAPQHSYYGQCIYCGHCQPCVVGINIAEVNKYADLALMQDEVPASVREHYLALDVRAGDCTGCASCEPNCPFGVPIAQRMVETAQLFGA